MSFNTSQRHSKTTVPRQLFPKLALLNFIDWFLMGEPTLSNEIWPKGNVGTFCSNITADNCEDNGAEKTLTAID